ncbi:MAG: CDP-diacylglycerol--glycerol-3-phosphate 3-phosphatidyltransferase [Bacilli bacterium]
MNLPTKITFSRIFIVFAMFISLFILSFFNLEPIYLFGPAGAQVNLVNLIVCIVFIIAASTDWLDGYLARKNNQVTDLGKFLDPVADKMLVNATLIFMILPSTYAGTQMQLSLYIVIVFIVRDLIVDSMRFVAAKKNIVVAANMFGKLKTVAQMVAIPIFLLNGFPFSYFDAGWITGLHIADWLMYIALFFSVLSGVIYIYQNRKVFIEDKHDATK